MQRRGRQLSLGRGALPEAGSRQELIALQSEAARQKRQWADNHGCSRAAPLAEARQLKTHRLRLEEDIKRVITQSHAAPATPAPTCPAHSSTPFHTCMADRGMLIFLPLSVSTWCLRCTSPPRPDDP